MVAQDSGLFRRAALERLASPERIDERLRVPRYPAALAAALALCLALLALAAAWLPFP